MSVENQSATYSVPRANLAALEAGINKLNARARKLGCPEISVFVAFDHVRYGFQVKDEVAWAPADVADRWDAAGMKRNGEVMEWMSVTVTGQSPRFDGWRFVATLEPVVTESGEALSLVMSVPGESCPAEFVGRHGQCDHCKCHRNRKQTFVVGHDDGRFAVVGRQCLRDFLGHQSPHNLASWAEILMQLNAIGCSAESFEGGCGSYEKAWPLESILEVTCGVIREFGWVSRSAAFDSSRATASGVSMIVDPPRGWQSAQEARDLAEKCAVREAEVAEAAEALEWLQSLDMDSLVAQGNTYLVNLVVLARVGVVSRKTLGLACSMIAAHRRAKGEEIARRMKAEADNRLAGSVKQRSEFVVVVERIIPQDGTYGTTYITIMTGIGEGNIRFPMVWFASGNHDLEENNTYRIKATVKSHGERNGVPQTILTRVSLVEELQSVA